MIRFGLPFLLGFSCLFLSEGAVFLPSNRTNVIFIPESTGRVVWNFTDKISRISTRTWIFYPSDGQPRVDLARIIGHGDDEIFTSSYEVAIEKPATLVLKNINLTYNGTYQFSLSPGSSSSEVAVYVAVKPNVTACSSPIIANESDTVSCTCQGQGGNPPADVTWYKDNHKISETGKEEKTLTLTNVTNEKHHGSYKCVAESYPIEKFQDEVKVEVIVNFKPTKTRIEVPKEAYLGENLVINCYSDGLPLPNITIACNVTTNIVSNDSKYSKEKVDYNDAGLYKCIAKNLLGTDTDSDNLIVKEKRPSTKSPPKKPTTQSTPGKTTVRISDGVVHRVLSPGAIVGICVSVLLFLVIVFIVVYWRYKKKENNGKNRGNISPNESNQNAQRNEEPAYEAIISSASGSNRSAPEKDAPPHVYAAVDKENPQGNMLYASLNTDAMETKRESKKEPAERAPQTNYASIDFLKTAKAAKDDPV